MTLQNSDIQQLKKIGISPEQIEFQIEQFKKGFPFLNIIRPATVGDGIIKLSEEELLDKVRKYNREHQKFRIVKFVPASGAASRMFKELFEFSSSKNPEEILKEQSFNSAYTFFSNLKKFAFYEELSSCDLLSGINLSSELSIENCKLIAKALLTEQGLNYGNKPKGLLKFHQYPSGAKTPTQEHLMEGALYASSDNEVYLHFTVSPEHLQLFRAHINESKAEIENLFEIKCHVSFSIQKPSTDAVAVDINNEIFRNIDGSMFFRPGGHGALIENLNEMGADIIFIKNIDNVVPDRLKSETIEYKKALAGLLLEYQQKIFSFLKRLKSPNFKDETLIFEIEKFVSKDLSIEVHANYRNFSISEKIDFLISKLNRPIRVCGMVKNEGEPGGGPFWAANADGTFSLQIVESSQIDTKNPEKQTIVSKSTHFNPVDLVCAIKDFQGKKFDLKKFIDQETGFISQKSKDGKILKALELPGLWNGAMSDWITLFVEVPLITFNPVKTVNDLLRNEHQPGE